MARTSTERILEHASARRARINSGPCYLELEMEHEEDEDDEPLEFVILESNTPIGKRKRCSRSTATVLPATWPEAA